MIINSVLHYCEKINQLFRGHGTLWRKQRWIRRSNQAMNESDEKPNEQEAGCIVRMWDESRGAAWPRHSDAGSWVMGRRRRTKTKTKRRRRTVPAEPVKPLMKASLASRGAIYSLWQRNVLCHARSHIRFIPRQINYDWQQTYQVSVCGRDNVGRDIQGGHLCS